MLYVLIQCRFYLKIFTSNNNFNQVYNYTSIKLKNIWNWYIYTISIFKYKIDIVALQLGSFFFSFKNIII